MGFGSLLFCSISLAILLPRLPGACTAEAAEAVRFRPAAACPHAHRAKILITDICFYY